MTQSKIENIDFDYILFGGTFDPPHAGHVMVVESALRRFPSAEVVVIPSWAPPVSSKAQKSTTAVFSDRVAMAVIAFDECQRTSVSSMEEALGGVSYTVRTVEAFLEEHPHARVAWLMGYDQFSRFSTWKDPKSILQKVSLIVAQRPAAEPGTGDNLAAAMTLAEGLGFKSTVESTFGAVKIEGAGTICFLRDVPPTIASSDVRANVAKNRGRFAGKVPPQILEYIEDADLYRN